MKDPILEKLKADAGVVLAELWRALRHQPAKDEWRHSQARRPGKGTLSPENPGLSRSGLCYFHLN